MTQLRPAPARSASTTRRLLPGFAFLDRPLASYHLILGSTGLLLAIGLVMVLSTSSASQLEDGSSPYSVFIKQLVGALIAVPMVWLLSRLPHRILRKLANPLLIGCIIGLILVLIPGIGKSAYGAERWIALPGGIVLQPSEFAKLGLLLWGANLLARKEQLRQLNDWRALLMPLLPGAALVVLLVMLGDDLGTTFLLLVILLTLLWVIGTPGRLFAMMLGLILFALIVLIVVEPYRAQRLTGFVNPGGGPVGPNEQAIQGKWAIGSGGIFGVGLGKSTQKWGWVPNDSNDFIFAILGEELGLIGTACVVFLYSGLALAGIRIARRMQDPFMRLTAAGITVWIVVQALVNICAVVGLLPITGVPLPLISQGLSSLLVTMAAIGVLLSMARAEPAAALALGRSAGTDPPGDPKPPRSPRPPGPPAGRSRPTSRPAPARRAGPAGPPKSPAQPVPGQPGLAPRRRVPARPSSAGGTVPPPGAGRRAPGSHYAGRPAQRSADPSNQSRADRNEV